MLYWHALGTGFSLNSTNILSEALADVMCVYFLQVTHLLATTYSLTREKTSGDLTQEQAIFNTYIKHRFLLLDTTGILDILWHAQSATQQLDLLLQSWIRLLTCELCTSRSFRDQIPADLWQRAGAYRTDPGALFLRYVDSSGQSNMA